MIKKITQVLTLVASIGFYSTASASYIFDIYDNSSTDVGTLGFDSFTGTNTLTNIVQADLSMGGVAFTLSDLLPASWTLITSNGVTIDTLYGEFTWGSPTYGPIANNGYEVSISFFANESTQVSTISSCVTTGCNVEVIPVANALGDGFPYTTIVRATDVPEPATLALFGIGLAGLGFARKKKKSA